MACPSLKQRSPVGGGYWMTLTAMGTTLTGHASGWPKSSDSGTVSPWSTSIWLMTVMSNSSRISDWAMWQARSA